MFKVVVNVLLHRLVMTDDCGSGSGGQVESVRVLVRLLPARPPGSLTLYLGIALG